MVEIKGAIKTRTQISLEEAQAIILDQIEGINRVTEMDIGQAQYQITAENIYARINLPPFARSPVDGYAIFHEDVQGASMESPIMLQVIGEVLAGEQWEGEFIEKGAVRIMTGAPIPDEATCVIRQEDVRLISTHRGEEYVEEIEVNKVMQRQENYCQLGEDILKDELMIEKGTRLEFVHIGMLMAQGIELVRVYQIPKVLLITTGNELLSKREVLNKPISQQKWEQEMFQAGRIYDYNLGALKHRFIDWKVEIDTIHCRDSEHRLAELIQRKVNRYDFIVTTGGVSVGKKDILHQTYELLGVEKYFWKVNMKPGSPAMFTKYQNTPILSLSGNPYAALVTLEVLAKPIIKCLRRDPSLTSDYKKGVLQSDFHKTAKVRRFVRVRIEENKVYIESKIHSSGAIISMGNCNGFLEVPPGECLLEKGTLVNVLIL